MARQKKTARSRSTSPGSSKRLAAEQLGSRFVAEILDEDDFYSAVVTDSGLKKFFDAVQEEWNPDMLDVDAVVTLHERLYDALPKMAHRDLEQLIEEGIERASLSLRAGFLIGKAYGRRVRESEVRR